MDLVLHGVLFVALAVEAPSPGVEARAVRVSSHHLIEQGEPNYHGEKAGLSTPNEVGVAVPSSIPSAIEAKQAGQPPSAQPRLQRRAKQLVWEQRMRACRPQDRARNTLTDISWLYQDARRSCRL